MTLLLKLQCLVFQEHLISTNSAVSHDLRFNKCSYFGQIKSEFGNLSVELSISYSDCTCVNC